ncbi:hypothetical protein CDAR_490111 [Caerostris darwini]|uniref:Uncharacterized protein n=1 Tax=Caerostris darwini TaxID=1538125 RepID=A0AAV4TKA4_9ARAC|nr:hypothetical protein CDAR_490111 [Caerostris darwini]
MIFSGVTIHYSHPTYLCTQKNVPIIIILLYAGRNVKPVFSRARVFASYRTTTGSIAWSQRTTSHGEGLCRLGFRNLWQSAKLLCFTGVEVSVVSCGENISLFQVQHPGCHGDWRKDRLAKCARFRSCALMQVVEGVDVDAKGFYKILLS